MKVGVVILAAIFVLGAEAERNNNCKLKKFLGAYKVKNLNSKENEDCEDDDEEKDDDEFVAISVNQDSGRNKLSNLILRTTLNCKLRKFVGAYKVKNLNSKENEDCEEEEVDDDFDDDDFVVNNDKQDYDNDKPSTNCKLRKFMGAYKVKNLNWKENEDCDEDEDDDDIEVNNESRDYDIDKSIEEEIATMSFDEKETTHSIDETEMANVVNGMEETKQNAVRCELRQSLAARISEIFNVKTVVDCDTEAEEDYKE